MCGRFVNHIKDLGEWEGIFEDWAEIRDTGYNVSPTQNIPVSTANTLTHMRWGLIPHWSKEISTKYATFNARAETITTKPTYRDAWKNSQRCLIPALGYYEWKQEGSHKQPYFVCRVDKKPIVFGGVWARGTIEQYKNERHQNEQPAVLFAIIQPEMHVSHRNMV